MTDRTLFALSKGVLITQVVLPLVFGVPVMVSRRLAKMTDNAEAPGKRRREDRKARQPSKKHALEPLTCPSCSAPVPLLAASFRCPHCAAEVKPPAEYVAAIEDRRIGQDELASAERTWRWSRWTSSWAFVWLVRVAAVVWCLLVGFCALALGDTWPKMFLWLPGLLGFFFAGGGIALASVLGGEMATLPPMPKRADVTVDAKTAPCTVCGAPIQFESGRLTCLCPYCDGDNYRAEVAAFQHAAAATNREAANKSLLDAVVALQDRRRELLLFFVFLTIAEGFYAVVFGLFAAADAIGF